MNSITAKAISFLMIAVLGACSTLPSEKTTGSVDRAAMVGNAIQGDWIEMGATLTRTVRVNDLAVSAMPVTEPYLRTVVDRGGSSGLRSSLPLEEEVRKYVKNTTCFTVILNSSESQRLGQSSFNAFEFALRKGTATFPLKEVPGFRKLGSSSRPIPPFSNLGSTYWVQSLFCGSPTKLDKTIQLSINDSNKISKTLEWKVLE